jgi:glycosyltransferase involved in cell wall biosynthesis
MVRVNKVAHLQTQFSRRTRQFRDLLTKEGPKGITDRVRRVASEWIAPAEAIFPVRREDVMAADLRRAYQAPVPPILAGQPLVANWVTTPGGPGSGGHTTLFRLIRYLESHGYVNRVYFYDVYGADLSYYEAFVRNYYRFQGTVASVDQGMDDANLVVATSWPTAYPVYNSRCAGKRFYLVQDFEPYFYPAGSISLLAESTYRMGFHGLSIGECYAKKLRSEYGMTVETFKYGCDISQYQASRGPRSDIVFYARRETARRGIELGLMALEIFAARNPGVPIHIYGDKVGKRKFRFTDHGHVSPAQLNEIYNQCYAGLTLSFTNVSLVALEMLAAGCIPVVNDTIEVRTDLNNPFVRYTAAYPIALAEQLEAVVRDPDFAALSQAAATSVQSITWDEAGASIDAILRRALQTSAEPARIIGSHSPS